MKVDSSIADAETAMASPATNPASEPAIERASHHVTPTAATPATAIRKVTANGESPPVSERGRGEQVVVERPVVDVADRRRRSEQGQHPVTDQRPQDEHVVGLVRVPRAARGQVRESHHRRHGEQPQQDGQVDPGARRAGPVGRHGATAAGAVPRATAADGHRPVDGLDHAGRQGQVDAEPAAVWKHGRIVRCEHHGPRHRLRPERLALLHRTSPRSALHGRRRPDDAGRRGVSPAGVTAEGAGRVSRDRSTARCRGRRHRRRPAR